MKDWRMVRHLSAYIYCQKLLFRPAGDSVILSCFAALDAVRRPERKGGRVVECAGLEIQCTVIPYRRFESDPFRHKIK